jgi:N-acetylmuramoyl-L-alanine amidase
VIILIKRIVLDAGHGGFDTGAVYGARMEKDDALLITLAVGNKLKEKGYEVSYLRTGDNYLTGLSRANMANTEEGDIFVSFHRNTSPIPNTYSGVLSYLNIEGGIEHKIANNIQSNLKKIGYSDLGLMVRNELVELNNTEMPSLLVKIGFLNTDIDNDIWDNNMDEIAKLIADSFDVQVLE